MTKTGLIGYGYWGKIMESKLLTLSNLQFIQTSSTYYPEVFNTADWVFIATPVESHYTIAKDCISKGINVFVEKPFCSTFSEAQELITLANEKGISLYVDNVFLLRSELANVKKQQYKTIKFYWHKNGPANGSLINDLLYHDLYILITIVGYKSVNSLQYITNTKDVLIFTFNYGDLKIEIDYNRVSPGEKKKILYLDNIIINFANNTEDPLKTIIERCLLQEIDFESNHILNLQTVALMENITQYMRLN